MTHRGTIGTAAAPSTAEPPANHRGEDDSQCGGHVISHGSRAGRPSTASVDPCEWSVNRARALGRSHDARNAVARPGRLWPYKLLAKIERVWRWEFWPLWLFYLPLAPWILYLSLRHRGLTTITAANPGIPHGGVVGESKYDILRRLPPEWTVGAERIDIGEPSDRTSQVDRILSDRGWPFPVILKPDAGQRGAGVKLVRSHDETRAYVARHPQPIIVQPYHPGPYEAGIFYYRFPGEQTGRVFSITDKHFPVLVGDGRSTVEQLIWRHPRFRMQAARFLQRHCLDRHSVLMEGKPFPLAIAGNHCQGTMFRDGAHLITPALERTVDRIARQFEGFYFGRFDVRYADVAEFKAGKAFAIVELNGVTSESTNIYDPTWSLLCAYRVLFQQWAILFRIGAANRRSGHTHTALPAIIREARQFYRNRSADLISD